MMEAFLVPERTLVSSKGDGSEIDVSRAQGRIFLLTLAITNIIEQESLDVGIFGSADGVTWDAKPIVAFPQKFYRGEVPLLLNLTARPEVRFIRAHWEVARWGRGSETPSFEFTVKLREVPQEILAEAAGRVRTQ
ncbi:MAG TPA: hypothetical protein VK828_06980 [Terriglobales bacterium]|jgi:hypothetical protein|nr:hypothetical protein [Terriglobales bacterium]